MSTDTNERNACGREQLLVTVLYGEATAEERAEFEAHRTQCTACDGEFAAFSEVRGELRGWEMGAVPRIEVVVRPGVIERMRRAFTLLPGVMRLATAGAFALLLLALFNTQLSVGANGFHFSTHLLPQATEPPVVAGAAETAPGAVPGQISNEQIERIVSERCNEIVRQQLAAYRIELDANLDKLERQVADVHSSDDVKQLAVKVAAQRKKIDELQRDLYRTAGYGGNDLFGDARSGS